MKYKATRRLNIALEWTFHPSASDKLDGAEAPLGIESTGIFKNTDCYSSLRLMLTYSFSQRCKTCNKDYCDCPTPHAGQHQDIQHTVSHSRKICKKTSYHNI